MNKTTIDARKRGMLTDMFGEALTRKILGEAPPPAAKEASTGEKLAAQVKQRDGLAGPYIADLITRGPR